MAVLTELCQKLAFIHCTAVMGGEHVSDDAEPIKFERGAQLLHLGRKRSIGAPRKVAAIGKQGQFGGDISNGRSDGLRTAKHRFFARDLDSLSGDFIEAGER